MQEFKGKTAVVTGAANGIGLELAKIFGEQGMNVVLADIGGLSAIIEKKVFSGSATMYTLRLPTGSRVEALLPSHRDYELGESVQITTELEHLIAFAQDNIAPTAKPVHRNSAI